MTLAQEDIQFIKDHLGEWLAEQSLGKPLAVYEVELRERMVRVEEELTHQRALMREGFQRMDERFEAAEQRQQELRQDMLARFEQVDKRFEQVDKRFEESRQDMLARFEQVDKHHVELRQDVRELQRRMDRFLVWSFSTTVAVGGLVVTLVKFWNP